MRFLIYIWTVVLCLLLADQIIYGSGKSIEGNKEPVAKRRKPKSQGSEHRHDRGFEMFSMMDFPHKRLEKYAADPVQKLIYSQEDLGQINGILMDKDIIDLQHLFPEYEGITEPTDKEISNLVPDEKPREEAVGTPSTIPAHPSLSGGYKPNAIKASDINFLNSAFEFTKPTKKQTSTRIKTTKQQQYPVSRARLRELMLKISMILNEDVGRKPTKSVTADCTKKDHSGDFGKKVGPKNNAKESSKSKNNDNVEPGIDDVGFPNPVEGESKQRGSKIDSKSPTKKVNISTDKEDASEGETIDSARSGDAVEPGTTTAASTTATATAAPTTTETASREISTKPRDIPTQPRDIPTQQPLTTRELKETTDVEAGSTLARTTQTESTPKLVMTKPTAKPTETAAVTTGLTKIKPMNTTKVLSRIVNRYKDRLSNKMKHRIFKIREWRLPLFTIRKPCPISVDAMFTGASNKVYAIDGEMMYVIGRTGVEEGPVPLATYWPDVTGPVDDAYVRTQDRITVIFYQGSFVSYYNDRLLASRSNGVAALGIPRVLSTFDAVSTWTNNRKTYYFKGSQYWRYNDDYRRMDYGYPRSIKGNWKGVPDDLDTAFIAPNQFLYFVKKGLIYKMEYYNAKVQYRYPKRLYDSCYEFFM